ncbi:MAG: diguanylate cyclase [Succinivibrio sp.]|nr:diguanylate cyclase [Succinivibrio sp.]
MNCWIVVVDDEMVSLANAKTILTEEGMRVSRLRSGKDLLKFMARNTPDLILLDIMMPEMDGFETYQALRRFEEEAGRERTPVIFLTGAEDTEVEHRGLEIGASDFIHKPFNKDILIRRIYNIIMNAKVIESLKDEATVDNLTGFWSRVAGTKRIEELCESRDGTLMILDLDNFKLVNDLYGHEMGDKVLKTFADVVRRNTRKGDVVVRIGGDEFTAFCCNLCDETGLAALCSRLNEQYTLEIDRLLGSEHDLPLGISIGAVMVPDYGRDYGKLFPLVDSSLYQAKHKGKRGYVLHAKEVDTTLPPEENLKLELERITQIVEERSDKDGALLLGLDQFSSIYRFVKRFSQRYGGSASKFLFVVCGEDDLAVKIAAQQFSECLQKTLRRSDIIMQNKSNEFFVLLPELEAQHIDSVLGRIMRAWDTLPHAEGISIEHICAHISYKKDS